MAQKQYSFDFVLNAVLNGGFSGVFTKAQQEFIRLGGEIKNLQAIQRDIAAYQKQQQAVQNTTAKLDNLRRQYELVNRQISETTGSTTALEREKLKLEQRIANTSNALEKQQEKLNGTKERLDAAGVSTDDLAGKDAALTEKIKELTEEQKKATEEATGFGGKSVMAIEAVGGAIAAAGIAGAMREIADAYSECVGVAGDFEQAMSAVEAIAEANNREMAALTAEAKELGATTIYTAQQSANAMEYMAMAGWDATEMLAGMKGMTTLAAAAGEDLAQVSDIVTDNLTAFGMQASDTAHFADVLAAAAAKSNTNISIMGETFKSSAAVAGALGYRIEDVAVMTGLMADAGVKGSRAGTTLRNIFNGLLSGATLTADAFGELDYSAVNYDGTMKGLMETVSDLRYYFDQMTEAERVNNAMTIAGMRGYNGLLAILNATDEDFQSLYDSINNCSGAAERMASVKLDNLNGDVTIMNSAMEALQNTIGEQFNPELRELARTGTEVLNWANGFIQENPALVKGVMAGGAAFGTLATGIVGVNAAIKVFQALKLASLFTSAGPLLAVAGGIAVVTGAVVAMKTAADDSIPSIGELTEASRQEYEQIQKLKAEYEEVAATYGETSDQAVYLAWRIDELTESYQSSKQALEDYVAECDTLNDSLRADLSAIRETFDSIDSSEGTTLALVHRLQQLASQTEQTVGTQEEMKAIIKELNEVVPGLALNYDDVISGVSDYGEAIETAVKAQAAMERYQAAQKAMVEAYNAQYTAQQKLDEIEGERAAAQERYNNAYAAYRALVDSIPKDARNASSVVSSSEQYAEWRAAQNALDSYNSLWDEYTATLREATEAYDMCRDELVDYIEAMNDASDSSDDLKYAVEGVMERVQSLAKAYEEAYEAAKDSFEGQFGLFDEAKADADATIANAQKALDSQLKYWKDFSKNMETLKNASGENLNITQENMDALIQYLKSGGPEAAGLLANLAESVEQGDYAAVEHLAETIGEVNAMRDQDAQDMADWIVGLTEQMDGLIGDMKDEIGELDLSYEARKNGMATMQAYVDAAKDMLPQVYEAYSIAAQAARRALGGPEIYSYFVRSNWTGSDLRIIGAYASGTENAPPGWAWVGEEGPELMRMHGGEQILPTEASRRLAEDYSLYNTYAAQSVPQVRTLEVTENGTTAAQAKVEVHVHVEAGAAPETVNAWQNYASSGELKAVVLEVLEDAEADMKRRALV